MILKYYCWNCGYILETDITQKYCFKCDDKLIKMPANQERHINMKIAGVIRGRIISALKGKAKCKRSFELLGCDLENIKKYLEDQFENGMSWLNHGIGKNRWQIDHIRPCASFDLSSHAEQQECFHYTNLQPLWASDNSAKGSLWNGIRYRYT